MTSGDYQAVSVPEPYRMMRKRYHGSGTRNVTAHKQNRCTLCFSTHVRRATLKSRMRTPWALCLVLHAVYSTLLHSTPSTERWGTSRRTREKERESRRSARGFVPFASSALFLLLLLFFFLSLFFLSLLSTSTTFEDLFCHGPGT